MAQPEYLDAGQGRRLAYHRTGGAGPTVVFLGGFKSDMEGTKAIHLEDWAKARGQSFLRFDYTGHGQSSGAFTDGCIGDWADDAQTILDEVTEGPLLMVGSSMGGWISLLMTKRMPERIAGLVTVAAAPDFTEDSMWAGFDQAQRLALEMVDQVALPSEYGEPYIITKRLIEDGRDHLVLRDPLPLPFPVRFLQGTADEDVTRETALKLLDRAEGADMHLEFVKGADHRFSDGACLTILTDRIEEVLARAAA